MKTIFLLLAVLAVAAIAGCSNNNSGQNNSDTNGMSITTNSAQPNNVPGMSTNSPAATNSNN